MRRLKRAAFMLAGIAATVLTVTVLQVVAGSGANGCTASGSKATQVRHVERQQGGSSFDYSPLIQAAIDTASRDGGAIVQLPAGLISIERPLAIKSNVALKGTGQGTVLKAGSRFLDSKGPYGGHPLITTDGASDITIADLTADQSGDVLDGNISGRLNEYLIDVRLSRNALVEGVYTKNPFTYSIAVVGSSGFCVRNNNTVAASSGKYDQLDGIHITDSDSGTVIGNKVDQRRGSDGDDGLVAQTIGAPVHDIMYRDNEVRGGSHGSGMQLAVGTHEIYNITIANNRFWGSPNGIQTGYYHGRAAVHDVTVTGNIFVDNAGPSVDFFGDLRNIIVSDNSVCRSGELKVVDGSGNRVANTLGSC